LNLGIVDCEKTEGLNDCVNLVSVFLFAYSSLLLIDLYNGLTGGDINSNPIGNFFDILALNEY